MAAAAGSGSATTDKATAAATDAKKPVTAPAAMAVDLGAVAKAAAAAPGDSGKWICSACEVWNAWDDPFCVQCRCEERPGANGFFQREAIPSDTQIAHAHASLTADSLAALSKAKPNSKALLAGAAIVMAKPNLNPNIFPNA